MFDTYQISADGSASDLDDASVYSSASLTSSIFNHVYENGRRYHAFRAGAYLNPDDEEEQGKLAMNFARLHDTDPGDRATRYQSPHLENADRR